MIAPNRTTQPAAKDRNARKTQASDGELIEGVEDLFCTIQKSVRPVRTLIQALECPGEDADEMRDDARRAAVAAINEIIAAFEKERHFGDAVEEVVTAVVGDLALITAAIHTLLPWKNVTLEIDRMEVDSGIYLAIDRAWDRVKDPETWPIYKVV